ncbi:MAG: hypothetical protein ABIH87_03265, partial [bacterium]
ADAMNAGNAVVNDSNVIIYQGKIKATAGDITVERMRFEGGHETAGNTSTAVDNMATVNWTDLGLYTIDANSEYVLKQNITNSNMTTGEIDFDTLSFVVANGTTEKFVVKGTVASTVSSTATTIHLQLDTVTAKDKDNDDASVVNASAVAIATGYELETTRTVTLAEKGILYVSMRNADSGFNKDRVLLAGTDAWVGKLRLRALYEDIKVQDIKLTNATTGAEDSVEQVCLYSAQSTDSANKIGCATMDSSDIVFFDDINYVVTQGTHDVYIYLETNPMSNGGTGTSDTKDYFDMYIATTSGHFTAVGVDSGETFTFDATTIGTAEAGEIVFDKDLNGTFAEAADEGGTASTSNFYVAGSRISNVELVSSYGGETVSTAINGTGVVTLAILAITTEANNNTDANGDALKLALNELRFDLTKFASTTLGGTATATIKRIGSTASASNLTYNTASSTTETTDTLYLTAATTTLGNDALIEANKTVYFVVKGEINSLSATANIINWIQVGLSDIKGTAGSADADNNIDWFDGYDNINTAAVTLDYDYLLLDTTSISGTKISAPINN